MEMPRQRKRLAGLLAIRSPAGPSVVVLPLGVVHLVGVLLLGLGHAADHVLLRTLGVAGALLTGSLDLGLLAATLVGHGNHHSLFVRFPASPRYQLTSDCINNILL